MARKNTLQPFEGKDVVRSTIAITSAGDGLSQAMKVDPVEFHQGDRVYVVLECDVAKVAFAPISADDASGAQMRVHTFKAGTATIVDADLVAEVIDAQEAKNNAAREAELLEKEQKAGVQRLPLKGDKSAVAERVETWLRDQPKGALRDLCDKYGVSYTTKTTALEMVDLLGEHADKIKEMADAG